jgi:RNA-binding protein
MSSPDPTPKRSDLISRGNELRPVVLVGKDGLSPGVMEDARQQLKARKLVKVKVQTRLDKNAVRTMAEEMAAGTGSKLIQVKGRTFLLHKDGTGDPAAYPQ